MQQESPEQHHEDPRQRDQETLHRELDELTSELRMVIPGVTVLVAFLSTAVAVVFLLSEGAYHQVRGKPYSKGRLLKTAILIIGMWFALPLYRRLRNDR